MDENIKVRLAKIDNRLNNYNGLLRDHIRRTTLVERRLDILEKIHYKFSGALSLLSVLAIIATIIEVVILFIKK